MFRFRLLSSQKWRIFEKKTTNYKWVILSKLGHFKHFELKTLFYRVFYGLSKYQKNIEIGQIKLKL